MTIYFDEAPPACLRCGHEEDNHLMIDASGGCYWKVHCQLKDCGCIGYAANNLDWMEQEAEHKHLL